VSVFDQLYDVEHDLLALTKFLMSASAIKRKNNAYYGVINSVIIYANSAIIKPSQSF